jgi:hypothetical protein
MDAMIHEMTTTQKAQLICHPVDKNGAPREVENLTFATSDETIAMIETVDGIDWVVATGAEGQCEVSAKADTKIGDGVREITDSFTLAINHPEAVSLGFGIGEPVEKG